MPQAASEGPPPPDVTESFVLRHDRTFAALAPELEGPRLARKKWTADVSGLFSELGFAPGRVNEGRGWYLEEYGGLSVAASFPQIPTDPPQWSQLDVETLGRFLVLSWALMHKQLPTAPFDHWRARIRADLPWTEGVPENSYVWKCAFQVGKHPTALLSVWAQYPELMPVLRVASRLVTCCGSFARHNIRFTRAGELQVVDFEEACVACAAVDLSSAFFHLCRDRNAPNYEDRRAFARGYCLEFHDFASEKDEEDMILDAQIVRFAERLFLGHQYSDVHEAIRYVRNGKNESLVKELRQKLIHHTLTDTGKHWATNSHRAADLKQVTKALAADKLSA